MQQTSREVHYTPSAATHWILVTALYHHYHRDQRFNCIGGCVSVQVGSRSTVVLSRDGLQMLYAEDSGGSDTALQSVLAQYTALRARCTSLQ